MGRSKHGFSINIGSSEQPNVGWWWRWRQRGSKRRRNYHKRQRLDAEWCAKWRDSESESGARLAKSTTIAARLAKSTTITTRIAESSAIATGTGNENQQRERVHQSEPFHQSVRRTNESFWFGHEFVTHWPLRHQRVRFDEHFQFHKFQQHHFPGRSHHPR